MNREAAIFGAAALLIVGVLAGLGLQRAEATAPGPYQIAGQAGPGNVWVANTATGEVRLCRPPLEFAKKPKCGPWGR